MTVKNDVEEEEDVEDNGGTIVIDAKILVSALVYRCKRGGDVIVGYAVVRVVGCCWIRCSFEYIYIYKLCRS